MARTILRLRVVRNLLLSRDLHEPVVEHETQDDVREEADDVVAAENVN